MSVQVVLTITANESEERLNQLLDQETSKPKEWMQQLRNFLIRVVSTDIPSTIDQQIDGGDAVAASGTFTFSNTAANNDTVLINGVTFTAKTSGATGNQFNIGASATASAANLAAAINASATALVSGLVSATSALGVVTVTARAKGVTGNAVTIAEGVDSGSVITVSGARLTGGTDATANTYRFGI